MQEMLSEEQVQAFHHDLFVEDQARQFIKLVGTSPVRVTDVGGGCGFFAQRVHQLTGARVRVLDTDQASIDSCRTAGVEATLGNALDPSLQSPSDVVSFNLILHHLVGNTAAATRELQRKALMVWRTQTGAIFVNEYIYESYVGYFSGWFIFRVTQSKFLSSLAGLVARVVPSLKANTFGVGVRFRAHDEWLRLFESAGYKVRSTVIGDSEPVSLPRRLLMIRQIRRDSFLLEPRADAPA